MDVINKLEDESNQNQEQLANALKQRAHQLHAELLGEIAERNFDIFQRDSYKPQNDSMILQSETAMIVDKASRKKLGGPSILKHKFHASYWKRWHQEKTLLDNFSMEELARLEKLRLAKKVVASSEKARHQRKDRATFLQTNSKLFDSHLLGQTNVSHLLTHSLGINLVKDEALDPAFHMHFGSPSTLRNMTSAITSRNPVKLKGGYFSMVEKLNNNDIKSLTITKNCDIPPLPSSFDTITGFRGVSFTTSKRFSKSKKLLSMPANHNNNNNMKEVIDGRVGRVITGQHGYRFGHSSKSSTTLQLATPGPGSYKLPRLMDPKSGERNKQAELEGIYQKYHATNTGLKYVSSVAAVCTAVCTAACTAVCMVYGIVWCSCVAQCGSMCSLDRAGTRPCCTYVQQQRRAQHGTAFSLLAYTVQMCTM
jgi:hypothetical protein